MMKKLFVLLSLLMINFHIKAQDKINLSEVVKEIKNQKSLYYFAEIPAEKNIKDRLSGTFEITDTSNLDLLQLPVKISLDNYQYYLIENLDILLVIRSYAHIKNPVN
tara:strand:+ start:822 stop:1142 length:321 start_codon:yes stop_codon:yes gene_type:complete